MLVGCTIKLVDIIHADGKNKKKNLSINKNVFHSFNSFGLCLLGCLHRSAVFLPLLIVDERAKEAVKVNERNSVVALEARVVQPMEIAATSGRSIAVVTTDGCDVGMKLRGQLMRQSGNKGRNK